MTSAARQISSALAFRSRRASPSASSATSLPNSRRKRKQSTTVRGRTGDAGGNSLEGSVPYSVAQRCTRKSDHIDRQLGKVGRAGLVRDCDPDFPRELGTEAMDAKGRQQADDSARNPRADAGEGVVLGRFGVGTAVETTGYAFDKSIVHQAPQSA